MSYFHTRADERIAADHRPSGMLTMDKCCSRSNFPTSILNRPLCEVFLEPGSGHLGSRRSAVLCIHAHTVSQSYPRWVESLRSKWSAVAVTGSSRDFRMCSARFNIIENANPELRFAPPIAATRTSYGFVPGHRPYDRVHDHALRRAPELPDSRAGPIDEQAPGAVMIGVLARTWGSTPHSVSARKRPRRRISDPRGPFLYPVGGSDVFGCPDPPAY